MTDLYIRPKNKKEDKIDKKLTKNLKPNKRFVMVARKRVDENSDMVFESGECSNQAELFLVDLEECN